MLPYYKPTASERRHGAAMVSGNAANVHRQCYHQSVAELQKSGATSRSWNAAGGVPARSFTMLELYIFCETNVMLFCYFCIIFFCYEGLRQGLSPASFLFHFLDVPFFASMKQKREVFCCDEHSLNKSLATLLMFLVEPFFASMKQKRELFCCDEAKSVFKRKLDTCQAGDPEAGKFRASGGFSAVSLKDANFN
jgi:hypothetical protein